MKKNIGCLKVFYLYFLVATPVMAGNTIWTGVWNGTIGHQRITACFNRNSEGQETGSYYYRRYLLPIPLRQNKSKSNSWLEQSGALNNGILTLQAPKGDMADGLWAKEDGSAEQPIHLERVNAANLVSDGEELASCGSDAFNAALEVEPQITVNETQYFEGKRYRVLAVVAGSSKSLRAETVELLDGGSEIALVNRYLRNELPKKRADMKEFFSCRRANLSVSGNDGERVTYVELKSWTARWLSFRVGQTSSFCGGPHPSGGVWGYSTWDLLKGKKVDLWSLLGVTAYSESWRGQGHAKLPAKLKSLVSVDKECSDLEGNEYMVRLTDKGFVFELSATSPDCIGTESLVSYRSLLPFLNANGRAIAQSFIGSND